MGLKCRHCSFEGTRADFKLLLRVDSAGPDTYRLCPNCKAAVYCEELEVFDSVGVPWGAGHLRGRVFRRSDKSK